MNRNAVIAIVLIAIIGVAGVGVWFFIQPVENPYDVAIVFATGGLGDKSFNDGCHEGAQRAAEDFGITFTYVQTEAVADYEGYIRQYAEHTGYLEPYTLIICIGYDQLDPLTEVAAEYTSQQFAIVDESLDNESTTAVEFPNVLGLKFKEHEGSALVGAMAGLVTATNKIGFVGGMDIPLINKFAGGYAWGANYTNPACNVTFTYPWDFGDPGKGKTAADTLYGLGCDIVFAAAGATGLGCFESVKELNGTEEYPLWVIGVDSPQMYLGTADPDDPVGPGLCLTSMLKKVDVAVYDAIKDACEDNDFAGGVKIFDIANGGIDYELNSTLVSLDEDIVETVNELKEAISNGTIDLDPYAGKWWLE